MNIRDVEWLVNLWKGQAGRFFCVSIKPREGKGFDDIFFEREQATPETMLNHFKEHMDFHQYFSPLGFSAKHRRKEYAQASRVLWADIDAAPVPQGRKQPSILIESSPKRHAGLWVFENQIENGLELLNKRLTYAIDADKSGHDLVQVLRMPGTINYKYPNNPVAKLIRGSGNDPIFSDLKLITNFANSKAGHIELINAPQDEEVWDIPVMSLAKRKRILKESDIPSPTVDEILHGYPRGEMDRSEILWKHIAECCEAGIDRKDCFAIMRESAWNKFKNRPHQLQADVIKKYYEIEGDIAENDPPHQWFGTTMAEIKRKPMRWVWAPYFAFGEVTILEGDPGIQKSFFMQKVCAHICDGKSLPQMPGWEMEVQTDPGVVLYLDPENDPERVTKGRLEWSGLEHMENFIHEEKPFSIYDKKTTRQVEKRIAELKPKMIVFDTYLHYVDRGYESKKDTEATHTVRWFKEIAKKYDCAVVIIRHFRKNASQDRAIERGQGNMSFAGVARIILAIGRPNEKWFDRIVGQHGDGEQKHQRDNYAEPRRVRALTTTKNNTIDNEGLPALIFRILPDPRERGRAKFLFEDYVRDLTSDELSGTMLESDDNQVDIKRVILEMLKEAEGQMLVTELRDQLLKYNKGVRQLQRYLKELEDDGEIAREREGYQGKRRVKLAH